MESKAVVTRFAPSPTGYMHIGGVRTALFAWAYARKHGGTFILRIEDTDKAREVEGSIEHIIESLQWLGLSWDEGPDVGGSHAPYLQSQRLSSYKKYAQMLIEKGYAYADPYTEEEVETFRQKSIAEGKPFLYRDYRPENPPAWNGAQPLRFKIKEVKPYAWTDEVRGELSAGEEALDDFILIKSDGYPTYNFAHIIDDLEMGVTHIMRGDEFIASTPKFLALYEALEIDRPVFATLPPIMAPDGKKKLGKRDGAKDILEYRDEGYLPQAMMNFLAFIGWNPGDEREILSPQEFIDSFELSKVQHGGGKYNEEKLDWINKEHIKRLSQKEFWDNASKWLVGAVDDTPEAHEILKKIEPILRDHITKFSDIKNMFANGELKFFFKAFPIDQAKAVWKNSDLENTKKFMQEILEVLSGVGEWTSENIKSAVWPLTEKNGRGEVLWPLRYTLSGLEKSPDPFTIAEILGKDETVRRIENSWK
jgi:glutamyl-tRNA synthetase